MIESKGSTKDLVEKRNEDNSRYKDMIILTLPLLMVICDLELSKAYIPPGV